MTRELQVAPGNLDAIDRQMGSRIDPSGPGVVLAVSHGGKTVFSKAYGLADMERARPLEVHSALDAGSIIKTLAGLSLRCPPGISRVWRRAPAEASDPSRKRAT